MGRAGATSATLAALLLLTGCGAQSTDSAAGLDSGTTAQPFVVPTSPLPQASVTPIPVPERFPSNADELEGEEGEGINAAEPLAIASPDLRPGQRINKQVSLDQCRSQIDGRPVRDPVAEGRRLQLPDDPTAILVCNGDDGSGTRRAAVVTNDAVAADLIERIRAAERTRCPSRVVITVAGYGADVVAVGRGGSTMRFPMSWTLFDVRGTDQEVTSVGAGCGPVELINDFAAISQGRGSAVFTGPAEVFQ